MYVLMPLAERILIIVSLNEVKVGKKVNRINNLNSKVP